MKKRLLSLLLIPFFLLTGCNEKENTSYDSRPIEVARRTGEIGSFNLLTPEDGFTTKTGFTFTWEEASNCDLYQLEIANTPTFINNEDVTYVKEGNISTNQYYLNFPLEKDTTYYWRVTAVNKDHKKQCNEARSFYYQATEVGEIPILIEDEQDWAVHKEGSQAVVSIDRDNFFNNPEEVSPNSLVISFDKEHTSQGIAKSDGWIVITKSEDRELYGTDAFYFNFFYSGHDATVLIRVLDNDGEYWHNQVQISNNAKQTVLMKYTDFSLRTTGTNIFNREFDWYHIRYFEIVFERTFGDGVCVLSNIKAVQYDDYQDLFIQKLDFDREDIDEWTYENYNFEKYVDSEGALVIPYNAGFPSYGFQHVFFYKFFAPGDALRFKVKYTGSSAAATFYFRILELDRDIWQFKKPFAELTKDGYQELLIPLKAMQRMSSGMNGDGAKQFSFIQKLIFGLADNGSTAGALYIKDFEVVSLDDLFEVDEKLGHRFRNVTADGCVDNFDTYDTYTEIYYAWDQSAVNKDEAMKLDDIHKVGPTTNIHCAEFDYKADLEQAVYQLYMKTDAVIDEKNALSLWLKDDSVVPDDPVVSYLKDTASAKMTIQLTMSTGEWYRYEIPALEKEWNKYTILFSDFTLYNRASLTDVNPLNVEHIMHIAFGFEYFYKDQQGNSYPTYAIANPVYLDEIYFVNATRSNTEEISSLIKPDIDNPDLVSIDTFENYEDDEAMSEFWSIINIKENNSMALSNDVSNATVGGTKSLALTYKSADAVEFNRSTPFHKKVLAKGLAFDLKGDGKARIVIHLDYRENGTLYDMRYIVHKPTSVWTHYDIGFDNFRAMGYPNVAISEKTAKNVESIRIVITNSDETQSVIYLDNMSFLNSLAFDTEQITPIAQEGGFDDEIIEM